MRKIKFRAWDELNNKMKYLGLLGLGLHYEYYDELTVYGVKDKDGKVSHTAPVMQFTGLKDKNGKEIYEGDIIQGYYIRKISIPIMGEIKWSDKWLSYMVNGFSSIQDEFKPLRTLQPIEVIGNIYQNPKLLENNK